MPETLEIIPIITREEKGIIENKIIPRLNFMYSHLEIPISDIYRLTESTIEMSKADKPITEIERDLHSYLDENNVLRLFEEKMDVRALMWYQKISPHIKGKTFLDLGGGDGRTAKRVFDENANKGKNIEIIVTDVLDYDDRVRGLPYVKMQGTNTPFEDQSFDTVFLGTVYHHVGKNIDDPLELVEESVRLAKNRLIVIESVYQNETERLYTMWIDWFYNRVLHYSDNPSKKVNVPFNFRKPEEWKTAIESFGLEMTQFRDLKTFQILNPEHHWLYVADRK